MSKLKFVFVVLLLLVLSSSLAYGAEMKSYHDQDLGFSIKHPESWHVKKPAIGEGVSIEQKGAEHIQLMVTIIKNVKDEGDPYETVKKVLNSKLEDKGIEPVKFWKSESGIAFQHCAIYEESFPVLGLSNVTECSSFANNILYKVTVVMAPELNERYGKSAESIVNSFEIYSLADDVIEQNNIESSSKEANNSFVFSLVKWIVVVAVVRFVYKKIKRG